MRQPRPARDRAARRPLQASSLQGSQASATCAWRPARLPCRSMPPTPDRTTCCGDAGVRRLRGSALGAHLGLQLLGGPAARHCRQRCALRMAEVAAAAEAAIPAAPPPAGHDNGKANGKGNGKGNVFSTLLTGATPPQHRRRGAAGSARLVSSSTRATRERGWSC